MRTRHKMVRLCMLLLCATEVTSCARSAAGPTQNAGSPAPGTIAGTNGGIGGSGGRNSDAARHKPTVVLISFDAFRWDYLDRGITPNLAALAARGVRADGLIPIFPTKTFPNHYAIATGLYADRNGIAGNNFYDPALDAFYSSRDTIAVRDARFYRGEPIWVTAERQGMVTASLWWVGSEAAIGGIKPTLMWPYDRRVEDSTRLRALHEWLHRSEETRPHLAAVYFSVIDDSSHSGGPDSPGTIRAIMYADRLLGEIVRDVETLPARDSVSVVVVSDHGMTRADQWVTLAERVDTAGIVFFGGPVANAYFKGDSAHMRRFHDQLKDVPHVRAYYRSELPKEWHYNFDRAGDIVIVAEDHWQVALKQPEKADPFTHGYPSGLKDMQGVFIAAGPRIAKGERIPAFENIHVYPFVAGLLRIRPHEGIDSRQSRLDSILRN